MGLEPLEPAEISHCATRESARQVSGVRQNTAEFKGVLAGVGALGGVLAGLWSREAWGTWTYVDDDLLRPHNVIRHIAGDAFIGCSKAEAVLAEASSSFYPGYAPGAAIHARISDWSHPGLADVLAGAALLVDVTTTLEAPRDLSARDGVPRAASVFLTPSGMGSVMLLEDRARLVRLDALEAQYYRAILYQKWGEEHLAGHRGHLWVGAGCRDISLVMSHEVVQAHGATLARQLRLSSERDEAQIRVWSLDDGTGGISAHAVRVSRPLASQCGAWRIVWDEHLRERLFTRRASCLPSETGGILLGYHDLKLKTLHLVDALPAPSDSEADTTGFTRGVQGLREALERCARLTGHIVGYVGEWHSHPRGTGASPSRLDLALLAELADRMAQDGLPELMLIVGEVEVRLMLGENMPCAHHG